MSSDANSLSDEVGNIQFVLCQTADRNGIAMKDIMSSAMDIAATHGALVMSVLGTVMMATFGFPRGAHAGQNEDDFYDQRRLLVGTLIDVHGDRIRAIHGSLTGFVGTIGTEQRFLYGVTIPGINSALADLMRQDFGSCAEYRPANR